MSTKDLVRHMRLSGLFSDPASVDFIEKVMAGAGFAPGTRLALSPGILKMRSASPCLAEDGGEEGRQQQQQQQQQQQHQHQHQHQHKQQQQQPLPRARVKPTPPNHDDAVLESEEIIFSVVDELLLKSGASAADVDVVVTTCSCFAPVPSLAASVVNRFGMRADVLTASLVRVSCLERFWLSGGGRKERKREENWLTQKNPTSTSLEKKNPNILKKSIRPEPAAAGTSSSSIWLPASCVPCLARRRAGSPSSSAPRTSPITGQLLSFFPSFFFSHPDLGCAAPSRREKNSQTQKKLKKKNFRPQVHRQR